MHRSFRAAVLATTALLFPAYAYAQGGIVQSGVVTRGHAPVWAGNGTLSDAGTATSSFISTLGITSAVFPSFAISTSSAVSPENILQMGVTSTGGTIDLENPGTTALPLIFENNGFPELTLDSTGTVHISSLIVGTISISSFSFANPTFTGSMLFTSTQVYNSPTIAVPSITNFVENLSGTIGGGTLSPKVPNPFYNTQTITNGVTLNNAGGAYGWHWKETLNNAVGTNSVGLVELTQANATPADNGRTSSFESMGFYVTMNGLAGGTLPAQGLSNGFVYGTNPKTILQDGAQNYSLINNWGEGDVAISPVVRPIFASGSVTVGETDTIELVSTACGFPGGIALTATAAAGDTLGVLLNKFGSQILMNDTLGACGIGMALAGATSAQSNTLEITAPPNNISGVVDLTITFPPPSGGATAVYTLGTATLGASAQAKFGMTFVELKKDGVGGAAQNSVIGVAKQAGGAFPPTSGGWDNLVTFIGTTNEFAPDDTTVVPGQWPLDRLFNGVIANIPTQYAGTNDAPLQFPRMSSFLDLPNVEFLISDITTGLGPIVFPGYMLKGDGSEWIGSGTIQRLVGNAGTVGIQIQANGWEGTAIAVSNGGGPGAGTLTGHYYVNDITTCGFGDFEKVTATTATGGISTISVINDGTRFDYPSSGPGSAPSATCHPLGGSGTGAVYTITWSAGNTVTVGNSGGTVNLVGIVNGGTLSSDLSASTVLSTASTTSQTLANRFASVFSIMDYGAKCDGTTDDSTAINSALAAAAASPVYTAGYTVHVVGSNGQAKNNAASNITSCVIGSLNFTGFNSAAGNTSGAGMLFSDANLICKGAGKNCLDLTNARGVHIQDVVVTGVSPVPELCVQVGISTVATSAAWHTFKNLKCAGSFAFTGLYNFGSEDNEYGGLSFFANNNSTVGPIATLGAPTGGSGYTNGTYTGQALTGGTGSGALATIVVSGNAVTTVTVTYEGRDYVSGDALSAAVPGGTGFSISVTAVAPKAVVVDADNHWRATSAFTTITLPVDTANSLTLLKFDNVNIRGLGARGSVWIGGSDGLIMNNTYVLNFLGPYCFDLYSGASTAAGLNLDGVNCEAPTAGNSMFNMTGPTSSPSYKSLLWRGYSLAIGGNLFHLDTAVSSIDFPGIDISAGSITRDIPVFSSAKLVTASGKIFVPNIEQWNAPAAFQGLVSTGDLSSPQGVGPLDIMGSAAGAWSCSRQLRRAYIGAICRVQRASDSAVMDLYADGFGVLNAAPSLAFCAGTTCGISIAYDQSGNGNNATQATAANQPALSLGLSTFSGKPGMLWNTAAALSVTAAAAVNDIFATGGYMTAAVLQSDNALPNRLWAKINGSGASDPGIGVDFRTNPSGGSPITVDVGATTSNGVFASSAVLSLTGHVYDMQYSQASTANVPTIGVDGTALTLTTSTAPVGTISSDSGQNLILGNNVSAGTNRGFISTIGEIIFWKTTPNATRLEAIRRNEAAFYSISGVN